MTKSKQSTYQNNESSINKSPRAINMNVCGYELHAIEHNRLAPSDINITFVRNTQKMPDKNPVKSRPTS